MDEIMHEIFNRDSRTTVSLLKIYKQPTNLELNEIDKNCDRNDIIVSNKFTIRSLRCFRHSRRLLNCTTVALSICFILSTIHIEASPITRSKRLTSITEGKIFDHKCGTQMTDRGTNMNDEILKNRLKSILLACEDTLIQTKELSEQYIKVMWNTTIEEHHNNWKHYKVPEWIHPEGVPLKKQYSENISAEHKSELEAVHWKDHKKVFHYLGKIYQRLERIYVGVQIVNKWIEIAKQKQTMLKPDELEKSDILFKNVTEGIRTALCYIQELFMDAKLNPMTDLHDTPFQMDDLIKINHWLIYREYQNLMEYSNELLHLILLKYNEDN